MSKAHDLIEYKQYNLQRYNITMVCDRIDFKTSYTVIMIDYHWV